MTRPGLGSLLLAAGTVAAGAFLLSAAAADEPATFSPLTDADWKLSADEARGRAVYEKWCLGCHGPEGRGDGPASRFLDPLPRDFQSRKFKFRSTPFGEVPLESDLMRTVTCGLPGSSMPGFPLVPELERRDVVRYVLHLAKLGVANKNLAYAVAEDGVTAEQFRADQFPAMRDELERAASPPRVVATPEPAATAESVERGRKLYVESCQACHGARGVGDGPSSVALRDWQDAAIRPRDFTTGVFRAGSEPQDVFVRMKTGLTGTPMPSFSNLPDESLWDLVHFVLTLKDPAAEKPRMAPGCGHEGGAR